MSKNHYRGGYEDSGRSKYSPPSSSAGEDFRRATGIAGAARSAEQVQREVSDYNRGHSDRSSGSDYGGGGGGGGGLCFLTTAATQARGLADDCRELTVLRHFRDEQLMQTPEGRELVTEYYRIAPTVCRKIDAAPDAAQTWSDVYNSLVDPVVKLIDAGQFEAARDLYQQRTLALRERFQN